MPISDRPLSRPLLVCNSAPRIYSMLLLVLLLLQQQLVL